MYVWIDTLGLIFEIPESYWNFLGYWNIFYMYWNLINFDWSIIKNWNYKHLAQN